MHSPHEDAKHVQFVIVGSLVWEGISVCACAECFDFQLHFFLAKQDQFGEF